jgi:hypothetical protein
MKVDLEGRRKGKIELRQPREGVRRGKRAGEGVWEEHPTSVNISFTRQGSLKSHIQ